MDISTYEKQFNTILESNNHLPPYDNEDYFNYVKLNASRLKRWYKIGKLNTELVALINKIEHPQHWLLITEPWCGDAAHAQAFIAKLADVNPRISLVVQNRDAPASEIDNYLTNGGRSIPKLIVRDANGNDLFTWGPRPKEAQNIHLRQMNDENMSKEEKKIELQNWYNKDKGESTQEELLELLKKVVG
jgi:hypothetical protein